MKTKKINNVNSRKDCIFTIYDIQELNELSGA